MKNKKIIFLVLLLLITSYILVACAEGFTKGYKSRDEDNLGKTFTVFTDDGYTLKNGDITALPVAMTVSTISSGISDSIRLTATVKPDKADNKLVDWSVSFLDSLSPWTKDKNVTDYIRITPLTDGSNIIDMLCFAPFSEPIIITVASRQNLAVRAICRVNYMQRIEDVNIFNVMQDTSVNYIDYSVNFYGDNYYFKPNLLMSGGKVNTHIAYDPIERYSIHSGVVGGYVFNSFLTYNDEFLSLLEDNGFILNANAYNTKQYASKTATTSIVKPVIENPTIFGLGALSLTTSEENSLLALSGTVYDRYYLAAKAMSAMGSVEVPKDERVPFATFRLDYYTGSDLVYTAAYPVYIDPYYYGVSNLEGVI